MKALKIIGLSIALLLIALLGYMQGANKNINELGLDIFSMVKKIKGEKVPLQDIKPSTLKSIDHSEWAMLVDKFVSDEGKVDYRGLAKNKKRLSNYLQYIAQNAPASNWTKEEKLAYWINAYNAFTVKLIMDHYPIKSIKDISGGYPMINSPWDIKFFEIGGVPFDLNTIEHEILRKQFNEPRIHFAINCASISCPKLRNEAYLPKYLEQQLEDQAHYFINNTSKNFIENKEAKLSMIFNWFQSDFTKDGTLQSYLKKYNAKMEDDTDISYMSYNWGLN